MNTHSGLQILLLLQNFRNSSGSFLLTPMLLVSDLCSFGAVAFSVIIYWGVSRTTGYWFMANMAGGFFVNNFLKLTACVYRPWIREPSIKPPERALTHATGYSFPSGHTQLSVSFFGAVAAHTWKEKKGLTALCVLMVVLTGFSRCYLGVHTPQDVLVSMVVGTLLVRILYPVFEKIQRRPSLLYPIAAAGIIAAILAVIYFRFKAYPMDYIDGELIVDPEKMRYDGYTAAGILVGFLSGAVVESRFVRFETEGTMFQKVLRVLLGLPGAGVVFLLKSSIYDAIGKGAGHFILYGVLIFYLIAVYPALFTAVRKRLAAR